MPDLTHDERQRVERLIDTLEKALRLAYSGSVEHGSFLHNGGTEFVPSVFLVLDDLRTALLAAAEAGERMKEQVAKALKVERLSAPPSLRGWTYPLLDRIDAALLPAERHAKET